MVVAPEGCPRQAGAETPEERSRPLDGFYEADLALDCPFRVEPLAPEEIQRRRRLIADTRERADNAIRLATGVLTNLDAPRASARNASRSCLGVGQTLTSTMHSDVFAGSLLILGHQLTALGLQLSALGDLYEAMESAPRPFAGPTTTWAEHAILATRQAISEGIQTARALRGGA